MQGLNLPKASDSLSNSKGDAQGDSQKSVPIGHELARVVTAWSKLPPPLKAAILAIVGSATSSPEVEP